MTLPDYRKIISERKSPRRSGSPREENIEAVIFLSKDAATVQAKVRLGEKRFSDHLGLLRVEGEWKVFSKLYVEI